MDKTPDEILYYITVFSKPDDLVETTRGMVSYREWLEKIELPRFKRKGWPVGVVTNAATGEIALAHYHIHLG